MSIRENPTDFLDVEARQLIMTATELDLPPPEDGRNRQAYVMAVGDRYKLYSADRLRVGHYVVRSMSDDDRFGSIITMDNIISQSTVHLTTSQLVFLEKHRRLRPDNGKQSDNSVGMAFKLTPAGEEKAKRYVGFIEACLQAANDANKPLKRGLIEAATARHAALTGESKPSYNTMRVKIGQYCDHSFDIVSAVAPQVSSGNRTDRFSDRIEELLSDAVELTWKLKTGDWRNTKRFFEDALLKPDNADLRQMSYDEHGILVTPSDRTIQRRLGSVDKVQRALWRHGAAYAKTHFDIYMRQALPDHPLDIVDVDFTPVHVIVFDDERPIIYGRPHIIAFRDRKTGSILGYAISFMGATFEAFLEALKMAIMPKDMSRYPGLQWKQYGTFLRLGVDNDMALINDHVRWTLSQLGIQLVEYRPGHPWEKGGIERLFRTLNQDVIHNLPGATMANVVEREKFLEANKDVPKITLSELHDFVHHYICADYHVSKHSGLGMLRTLDGVPNQLWDEGIKKAKQRRPVDPDVLVRAVGNVSEVTIQKGSVRWDNLIYTHPDLLVVHADARHKAAVPGVNTTTYKAWRDPSDLGEIHLYDHHNKRTILVPIQPIDEWYAKGLRLYQHQKVMEHLKKLGREPTDFQGAFDSFAAELKEINAIRTTKRTRQALARLHAKATRKFARSRVVEVDSNDPTGSMPMDFETRVPPKAKKPEAAVAASPVSSTVSNVQPTADAFENPQNRAQPKPETKRADRKFVDDVSDDDDDISHLLSKENEQ
jgi:putative transposase